MPCLTFVSSSSAPLETFDYPLTSRAHVVVVDDDGVDDREAATASRSESPGFLLEGTTELSATRLGVVVPRRRVCGLRKEASSSTIDLEDAISSLEKVDSRDQVEKWIVAQMKFSTDDSEETGAEAFAASADAAFSQQP